MVRILALALLLLSACAYETPPYVSSTGEGVDALRAAAEDAWAAVGVEAPTDYELLFLDQETLADACHAEMPEGVTLGGCSFPGVVLLPLGQDPELLVMKLTHELGHFMHGSDNAHLDCPETSRGPDVMCLTGAEPGTLPTARDVAFIGR